MKTKVTRLDNHVDMARNLATITECPVTLTLQPAGEDVNVLVRVELDTFMRGCSAWYAQTPREEDRGFAATLENMGVSNLVTLRFHAVSGTLDASSLTRFTLNYRSMSAVVRYMGIGDGVVSYE